MSTEWKRRAGTVMGLTHRIYCTNIRYFVAFLLHDFPFKLIDAGGNRVILVAALHSYGVSIARQPDRVFSPIWHYWVNLASLSLITPNRPSPGQVGRQNHHMLSGTPNGHLQEITESTCVLNPFSNKQGKGEESKAHRETRSLWYGDHCSRRFGFTCRLLSLHTRDVCKELHVHSHVPERCALPRRTLHVLRFSFKL